MDTSKQYRSLRPIKDIAKDLNVSTTELFDLIYAKRVGYHNGQWYKSDTEVPSSHRPALADER